MCGIVGLITTNPETLPVPQNLKLALSEIQHRGYDGAGLVLSTDIESVPLTVVKNTGMIDQALSEELMLSLNNDAWKIGVAHTRYKTSGKLDLASVQPLISKDGTLALVHNGHLKQTDYRPDSLQILKIWERYFEPDTKIKSDPQTDLDKIYISLHEIFLTVKGAYSCLVLIKNKGLVAFRDLEGIRPLVWALHPNLGSLLASETISFKHLPDYHNWSFYDIDPGTGLFLQPDQPPLIFRCDQFSESQPQPILLPCLFEYIYLAHPDSVLNGLSVRMARRLMGKSLAYRIQQEYPQLKIDLVVPVPNSSCVATKALAQSLKIPYYELLSLVSEKPHARSFILPTQEQRTEAVRQKFAIKPRTAISVTNFKNLLLVDDSIVRGTTMNYLIKALRSAYPELEKIYVASIAPIIREANCYGIDIPEANKLIAYGRTVPEITKLLGADLLIYQDLHELEKKLLVNLAPNCIISGFEDSMFR